MAHIECRSRFLILMVVMLALGACGGLDAEQVGICKNLLPAMENEMAAVTVLEPEADPARDNAILLHYRVAVEDRIEDHWISCRFAGTGFDVDRRNLTGVVTDRAGSLTDVQLFMLRKFWVGRFGRVRRACADDRGMASLCGVDIRRTIAVTFLLSGAYAAIAGTIIAIHYGGVSFHMGTVLGFKALTAAVVGGIGSIPGAMLGGLLVAFVETFWSGYLTAAYRDIAVFGLLALALIFRPYGLVGRPRLSSLDEP